MEQPLNNQMPADWLFLVVIFRKQLEALFLKDHVGLEKEFQTWLLPVILHIPEPWISNRQLIGQLRISKQAMSKALRELKQLDYIDIVKNETDKRTLVISLAPKGKKLAGTIRNWVEEKVTEYKQAIGAERVNDLKTTLTELISYNDKILQWKPS